MAFFEGCPVKWAGKGWLGGERLVGTYELAWWTGGQGGGARARGGCKGFGSGGVGGRDTGPRDGANFATYVEFLSFLTRTKKRKMAFFVPTGAGLVDGGVDQGPWLQERVGGGVGAMAVPNKGEGWGLVGCSKEEQAREGVREGLAWRSGGVQGLRLRG